MKYLSVQTFQCGISVSGAATFTGGATINLLALNGATTSSEASLFLGAHGTNEGGQLVLQKGTSNTYAAHLDNYADQFRILYGTNTGSAGVALGLSLGNGQLTLPFYTTTSSFPGTAVGYLAFDSAGNIITTASPAGAVTSIIAGTGVSVSSATGNVTVSIGQSVATSATPSFDQVFLTNNGNGTNVKIGDDVWLGDVNAANTLGIKGQQDATAGYITFGSELSNKLGRTGTGALTWGGNTIYHEGNLTNLSQLTNGPGYITSAALSGYVPTSRLITINGTSYDLSADRTWTINTVSYTSRLQHQVKAGVAINKGQAVYVTTADGTNMIVGLASNASEATSSKTMGLLDATVAINGFANVVTEGLLAGLDTSTAGAAGDPVWLGTGGNLIYGLANKPSAPAHLVFIGIVTRKNNSNGEIFVKVQNGFELNEIHDVDIKTTVPVNGHILGFDGTLWVNKTIAGWLGYTPANASGTTNYISKFTGSTTLGNSQIYDNGTNVGIGTATPIYNLEVSSVGYTGFGIMSGANNTAEIGFQNRGYGLPRWTIRAIGAPDGSSGNLTFQRLASTFPLTITSNENLLVGTTTDAGYKLYVNGTGYFADNLKLQTGILSFDGVAGYWGNAIKYETGQLNLYQSGDLHLGVGGSNITLYKNTKIPHNQRFTAGGYSSTDGITIWGTQNASAGGDGFVGRNLYYNGTNYIYASTNDNNLWGTIAGMRVVGSGSNALEFIARPATNSGLDVVASDLDSYKRMVISYSGNVGIGTTSPGARLDVSSNGGRLRITQNANASTFNGLEFVDYTGVVDGGLIWNQNTGEIRLNSAASYFPTFYSSGVEVMRINTTGNVGIGTTSPNEKLTVVGKIYANPYHPAVISGGGSPYYGSNLTLASDIGATAGAVRVWSRYDGSGYAAMSFERATNSQAYGQDPQLLTYSETMRISGTGNVGIGTTAPAQQLHVTQNIALGLTGGTIGDTNNILFPTVNGTHTYAPNGIFYTKKGSWGGQIDIRTSYDWGYATDNAKISLNGAEGNGIVFYTGASALGSTERVRITSDGNVGIGTNSPQTGFKLDVNGSTVTRGEIYSNSDIIGFGANENYKIAESGNTWLAKTTGNVGIGTSSPNEKLHVSGNSVGITIDGTIASRTYYNRAGAYIWSTGLRAGDTKFHIYDERSADRFVIDDSGNVGIGTTSPGFKLDVNGAARVNQGGVNGSGQALIVAGSGDVQLTDGGSLFFGSYDYGGSTYIRAYDDGNIMYFYLNGTNMAYFRNDRAYFNANVGIGTSSPTQILHVAGNIRVTGAFYDSNNQAGSAGQILKSTGTGTDWVSLSEITGVDGSGTANYVTKWSDADTVTNSLIYDNGTNVGIGTTSPGYNFDVNGQVRVQDKLRVGTVNSGNGVVHMSSSATINPNTTTIVWAQNVSVGMCAFIEYYILNDTSLTDQRAGTIMVTWNQSGTPTIAHTETTTPDIGSTIAVNFTSSLVGSDARINAVNSSANPYTIVMSYKYF